MKKIFIIFSLWLSSAALMACSAGEDDSSPTPMPQPSAESISIESDQLSVAAVSGTYQVNVTCNATSLSAIPSYSWVEASVSPIVNSKAVLTIKVKENEGNAPRVATVQLSSGNATAVVTVSQAAPLKIGTTYFSTSSRGESFNVSVFGGGQWTATASDSWIQTAKDGEGTLIVTTAVNEEKHSRNGSVTVDNGTQQLTIKVNQESAEVTEITSPEGYHLVWHDEFNEGVVLGSDWTHEVKPAGWVNHELQTYVDGEIAGRRVTELVDGKLRINCFKQGGIPYSGRVYAKVNEGWTYGYIEARIQLPVGKGTWPAFWMMPVHFRSWPADGEIDIMEEVGANANYVSSSLHANAHVHSNNTQVTHEMKCATAESDFHVYAIKWTHENITTYVDGEVQLTYDNRGLGRDDWPYDDPFYVILNLAWGGDWGGYKGVDDSARPVTMKIDYIRVSQK